MKSNSFRHIRVIPVAIIALQMLFSGSVLAQQSKARTMTYQIIKELSQEEASDPKSVIIVRPVFKTGVTSTGKKWLDFDPGEIVVDYLGLPSDDPYRLPIVMQLHVEALRAEFERQAPQQSFWIEPLRDAEETARATVADIGSVKKPADLEKQLTNRRREFQTRLGALEKSIRDYAQKTDTIFGEPGHVGPVGFGPEDQYSVPIVIEPVGGRVRVVRAFVWRDCRKRSCVPSELTWRTLNADRENMIGAYHYIAEWPNGKRDEGDFRVDSDAKRIFRPGN